MGMLRELVSQDTGLHGRVHIRGYCSEEDLPQYYRACDVFVFPTRQDVWGFVLNEAMSSGLPVVSSDRAQAVRDLVRPGLSGFVVPYANVNALSSRMLDLARNQELRIQIGKRAREAIVANFTPAQSAVQFAASIHGALEAASDRHGRDS